MCVCVFKILQSINFFKILIHAKVENYIGTLLHHTSDGWVAFIFVIISIIMMIYET